MFQTLAAHVRQLSGLMSRSVFNMRSIHPSCSPDRHPLISLQLLVVLILCPADTLGLLHDQLHSATIQFSHAHLIVLSFAADTTCLPSGVIPTSTTHAECPFSTCRGSPLASAQTLYIQGLGIKGTIQGWGSVSAFRDQCPFNTCNYPQAIAKPG
jgi:hypothetical protein